MSDERCQETFTQKIVSKLYLNNNLSDVKFKFGDESIPGHKLLLAMSCPYFYDILVDQNQLVSENTSLELDLSFAPKHLFKMVLKYIYLGVADLNSLSDIEVMGFYSLCQTLKFQELVNIAGKVLHSLDIKVENVGKIYEIAYNYSLDVLMEQCMRFVDKNTKTILRRIEIFTKYPQCFLESIVGRQSFERKQLDIFQALLRWSEINPESDIHSVLQRMRLESISPSDFDEHIRPSGLITDEEYFHAYRNRRIRSNAVRNTLIVVVISYVMMLFVTTFQKIFREY